ncbi:MAG: undecaprenyl-diphosphate phosphatase [Lachnospiraceae bacterium]|jgi:undecaprenyl-diphosphatase|nr:undecaprenyl-diphosphate phosphatase [Lachnospiraceae bacterium]MDD3615887.1 undecaprenyl-diphosphate phosphatase [Lachnospiraceae bacterium]
MTFIEAILMGILQGITEFLPVSSSGHLALFKNIVHIETNTGILVDVLLHVGSLAAVIAVFRKDIKQLLLEVICIIRDIFANIKIYFQNIKEQNALSYRKIIHNNYRKLVILVIIASIPTAIVGLILRRAVEMTNMSLLGAGTGFLVTAVLLLVVGYVPLGNKIPKTTPYGNAFIVGLAQGFSVLPGISRSGTTIAACLLCGFNRKYAVKYSFIMSIPAIIGAMLVEVGEINKEMFTWTQGGPYLVGMVFAAITGFFAIRLMIRIVERNKLNLFAFYCFFIGVVAIVCNYTL